MTNPLSQYFRQPAIYIRLPSDGKFYPPGAFETTENGEYPVLPMTTLDEITYRTPDSLFNGSAVVSVIQSCMPNIKDAWKMPGMDIDTVLVAIRIATYGHELDISTECPSCENVADYAIDLRTVVDNIKSPAFGKQLLIGDLEIFLKPMSYRQMNENSMVQFEEQKSLQMLQDQNADDATKVLHIGEVLRKITTVTTKALAQNIGLIKTPQAQVTDINHIFEFLSNCDRTVFGKVRDYIIENKQVAEIQPLKIQCGNCNHEYQQAITLDMSNFFGAAS